MSLFLQRCHQRLCHRPCSQRLCEVRRPHSNQIFIIEISQYVNTAVLVHRRHGPSWVGSFECASPVCDGAQLCQHPDQLQPRQEVLLVCVPAAGPAFK